MQQWFLFFLNFIYVCIYIIDVALNFFLLPSLISHSLSFSLPFLLRLSFFSCIPLGCYFYTTPPPSVRLLSKEEKARTSTKTLFINVQGRAGKKEDRLNRYIQRKMLLTYTPALRGLHTTRLTRMSKMGSKGKTTGIKHHPPISF